MIASSKEYIRKGLKNLRQIVKQEQASSKGMSMAEIIRKTRQIRQELWEAKIASGYRHK